MISTWPVGSIPPAGTNDLKERSSNFFVPRNRVTFWFFGHRFLTHHTMELESYFDDSSDSRRGAAVFMRVAVYLEAQISEMDSKSCGITKRTFSRNRLGPQTARV